MSLNSMIGLEHVRILRIAESAKSRNFTWEDVTYNGNLAAKVIFNLSGLDSIRSMLMDDLGEFWEA